MALKLQMITPLIVFFKCNIIAYFIINLIITGSVFFIWNDLCLKYCNYLLTSYLIL